MVCTINEFNEAHRKTRHVQWISWAGEYVLPNEGESCPWCTEKFTIEDVKKERCGIINGKVAHINCVKQYEHEREIDRIINHIMEYIYKDELTFDIIPNEYSSEAYFARKPWFVCHTPDGDIKIGWRKRVISIEWQDNFKPFDMSIFDSEDVTKWNRGIHAWGENKAYEYISKVKNIVNEKDN